MVGAPAVRDRYAARVWRPWAARMAAALARGDGTAARRARMQALLDAGGVVAEPLLPGNAAAAAALTAAQFLAADAMTRAVGLSDAEALAVYTSMFARRAAAGDPLSVVLRVGDRVVGAFTLADHAEEDRLRRAARAQRLPTQQQAASTVAKLPPAVQTMVHVSRLAEASALAAWQARAGTDGGAPVHLVEMQTGALLDALHVHLPPPPPPPATDAAADPDAWLQVGATAPTLAQATVAFCVDRAAASGVYTHINILAHDGSFRSAEAVGRRAYHWRRATGAPARTEAWDVHVVTAYRDPALGLGAVDAPGRPADVPHNHMHAALTQLRPAPTHVWSIPTMSRL
jgi:hypothetical protein